MSDVQGALLFLRNGEKQHPNRKDICTEGTTSKGLDGPFSWHRRQGALRSEQRPDQNSGFPASGFGQPSAASVFGQAPGPSQNRGFGSGMQNGATFGQPSQQPGFGQQSNGFGQAPPSQGLGGFNQPLQPTPFGQPSSPNGIVRYGQQPLQKENAPFGQSQSQLPMQPAFGQQPIQNQIGFGGGFGGGFGQPPMNQQASGGFGQQLIASQQSQSTPGQPFSQQDSNSTNSAGGFTRLGPDHVTNGMPESSIAKKTDDLPAAVGDVSSYSARDATGKLISWKGRPVEYVSSSQPCYIRPDGVRERIWFSEGPPSAAKVNTLVDDEYPTSVMEAYVHLRENGAFREVQIPELPPRLDMIRWDV